MLRVGFEPTISVGERPKTYALDRTATGTGTKYYYQHFFLQHVVSLGRGINFDTNFENTYNYNIEYSVSTFWEGNRGLRTEWQQAFSKFNLLLTLLMAGSVIGVGQLQTIFLVFVPIKWLIHGHIRIFFSSISENLH